MSNTLKTLLVISALLAPAATLPQTAAARDASYPRVVGNGENAEIDYGPGPHGNLVGGGRAMMRGGGEDARITHMDPPPARSDGLLPVLLGGGEDGRIAYVPAREVGAATLSAADDHPAGSAGSRAAMAARAPLGRGSP